MTGNIKALLDFQTKLQGVANTISKEMVGVLDTSDRELLDTIRKGLARPFNGRSLKESMERLNKLCEQVYAIRRKAIDSAEDVLIKYEEKVAESSSQQAAEYVKNITEKKVKPLSRKRTEEIIKYQPFQGRSIDTWFDSWKESDKYRILSAIQQAVNNGITPQKAIDLIRGTKANDYKDGVLNVSRSSASMIARTITNGVSNEARLATLDANDDVIDGYQFLATLDARTSFVCGSLDGTIWKKKDRDQVRRPPLHPNCRSTLIPYIELKDKDGNVIEDDTDRAAAQEDFVQKAKERYEQNHPGKKWEALAATTRDKYYYKEQQIYDDTHGSRGASWKHVPAGTSFKDYLESQPDDFQRSWLGPKRYELYKQGKLKFEQLVNPDSGYTVPLSELSSNGNFSQNPGNNPANNTTTSPNAGYNNSSQTQAAQNPPGRTATELKIQTPITTVDDFQREFADRQLIYDQEVSRLDNELEAEKVRIENDRNLTERQRDNAKKTAINRVKQLKDDLLDRHRDLIFDTLWPDLNPNSLNREKLATEQVSSDRFIPLKPFSNGTPRWYDIKRERDVSSMPRTAKARVLDQQTEEHKELFKKGKEFFGRISDAMGYDITGVVDDIEFYGTVQRGYFLQLGPHRDNGKDIIVLDGIEPRRIVSTVTHELTHAMEKKYPALRSRIEAFYLQITTPAGATQNRLKRIPGAGYGREEKYREATIPMPPDKYALKEYPEIRDRQGNIIKRAKPGGELLTQFFTLMIEKPEVVVKDYPDWFNGMMACLKQ